MMTARTSTFMPNKVKLLGGEDIALCGQSRVRLSVFEEFGRG